MRLTGPTRVAAHPVHPVVALADTGGGRVVVLGLDGRVVHISAGLARPHGLAWAATGLVVCEAGAGRIVHLPVDPGAPADPAPPELVAEGMGSPTDLVLEADGRLVVADPAGPTITAWADGAAVVVAGRTGHAGHVDGAGRGARLLGPVGLAVAPQGLLVVDRDAHALRVLAGGALATLVGRGPAHGGHVDGPAATAALRHPSGVCPAPDGLSAYVADAGNDAVRLWSGVDGELVTVPLPPGTLSGPSDVAVLPDGRLLVADTGHDRLVVIDLAAGTSGPLLPSAP